VGTVEVVVFSDVYTQASTLLKSELPIYVKGTVDHNEDSVKILAKEILSLDEMKLRKTKAVHLNVQKDLMSKQAFEELKTILVKHPGSLPTFIHLINAERQETILALPPDLEVTLSEDFIVEVERLLGGSALVLN
jgi:DNA polymerase III subunit alpha